jgi:glycosyltransferase involved in cell wall biosynthesis
MHKFLVVSLRFNPGHFSHLIGTYKLIHDAGLEPILYVHRDFDQMDPDGKYRKIYSASELCSLGKIQGAVIWFPSARNVLEILRLKYRHRARLVYIYHEPFESISKYMASGFGLFKAVKILMVNLVSLVTVALVDRVVLPSSKANEIYARKYRWMNRDFAKVPLIFDDEASAADLALPKTTIAYIGTVAADHAFDKFVSFVEAAIQGAWFLDYNFAIGTKSNIPEVQMQKLRPLLDSGRLIITQGKPLTTIEINRFYRDSLIVWNAYNRSMQSGVLPKAYMFGAAVIVSRAGESEFVEHEVTGMVVASNDNVDEIKRAVEKIVAEPTKFARACRAKFETTFYYKYSAANVVFLEK